MNINHVQSISLQISVTTIKRMIAEYRHSDAVIFLFYLHKFHLQEWVIVKRMLLSSVNDCKSLQTLASILDASKKHSLSESARIIPGLNQFFHEDPIQELLD